MVTNNYDEKLVYDSLLVMFDDCGFISIDGHQLRLGDNAYKEIKEAISASKQVCVVCGKRGDLYCSEECRRRAMELESGL